MAKRPSNKPQFQEAPKEDKKSVSNSQINDSKEAISDKQGGQPQPSQSQKFEMPAVPKFQSLQLREYFDSRLTAVLLEGLKEVGRARPENPTRFLGEYLISKADQK